jgi:DNA-directed RNA polymerase subunit RPC12/RpoP
MKCLDCGQEIFESEGYYGRYDKRGYQGVVCNKCIFAKMTEEEKRELLKMIR